MYAHKKENFDDLKEPGDWMETNTYPTEGAPSVPYGITMVCKCGDIIGLRHSVHTILDKGGVLDVSPSIGHYNTDGKTFKCHYFIKDGELVNA